MSAVFVVSMYVLWVFFLILALGVLALFRFFGQMYANSPAGRAEQGPEVGSTLLSLAREDTVGRGVTLPGTRPAVILFANTRCDMCAYLRDHLEAVREHVSRVELVVICGGQARDVAAWASRAPEYVHVVADVKGAATHHYAVNGSPYVISVGHDGVVRAKGIINDENGLSWAVDEALALTVVPGEPQVGEVAQA